MDKEIKLESADKEIKLKSATLVMNNINESMKDSDETTEEGRKIEEAKELVNEFILQYIQNKNISYIITNEDDQRQYQILVPIEPTFGQIATLTKDKIEDVLQNPSFSDKVQICGVPMSSKQGQDFLNTVANINYAELYAFFTLYQIYINNKISSRNKKKN